MFDDFVSVARWKVCNFKINESKWKKNDIWKISPDLKSTFCLHITQWLYRCLNAEYMMVFDTFYVKFFACSIQAWAKCSGSTYFNCIHIISIYCETEIKLMVKINGGKVFTTNCRFVQHTTWFNFNRTFFYGWWSLRMWCIVEHFQTIFAIF